MTVVHLWRLCFYSFVEAQIQFNTMLRLQLSLSRFQPCSIFPDSMLELGYLPTTVYSNGKNGRQHQWPHYAPIHIPPRYGTELNHYFCTSLSDEERVNFARPKKIVIKKTRKKTTQKIETVKY